MTAWIPRWLARVYSKLLLSFGSSQFTVEQARDIGIKEPHITLPRLTTSGWVQRVTRGRYVVSEPLVAIISSFQNDWRRMIKQPEYLPLLEFLLSRLLEGYGRRLKGLLLFGSVARGRGRPESDVDLIVVAAGMPPRYGDRVRKALAMLPGLEYLKGEFYADLGLHPNVDLILLDDKEFGTPHPFYLDVVKEGIVLFDREGFTASVFGRLRTEFERVGAVRVERADGRWHWVIPRMEVA